MHVTTIIYHLDRSPHKHQIIAINSKPIIIADDLPYSLGYKYNAEIVFIGVEWHLKALAVNNTSILLTLEFKTD